MTKKERTRRAKIKKQMQEKGILPPDKKRLNRKKFIEEARQEWDSRDQGCCIWDVYLQRAVGIMIADVDHRTLRVSAEAVGAAKCLKLAVRLKAFNDMIRDRGETKYTVKEQYDFIRDILEA